MFAKCKTPLSPLLFSGLQGCRRFQWSTVNYSTLLLEEDRGLLYVGARGAVFALNATDISANTARIVSMCVCVYLSVCVIERYSM